VESIKYVLDNWGLRKIVPHLLKSLGGFSALRLFGKWEDYYLYVLVKSMLQCIECVRPPTSFAKMALELARRRRILDGCRLKAVPQPKRPYPQMLESYFQMVEDVLISRACDLATRPLGDVIPDEEAEALYQLFISSDWYSAVRTAIHTGVGTPKRGRALLIGAGTQEPLDFIKACEILNVKCDFAALEVDEKIYRDLERLAAKHGFTVYLGWDSVKETFDIAVATNVLNWATDPSDVLARARHIAKELLLTQGVVEGMSTVFLLAIALRAQRPVSWREVEGLARQAGWRLVERYAKYPVYIAMFR
jgi:hypothetical protein